MNISETVSKQEIRPEGVKSIPNHCQHSLHDKVYLFDKGIGRFLKRGLWNEMEREEMADNSQRICKSCLNISVIMA